LSRNSGSHNLLDPKGPVEACNGVDYGILHSPHPVTNVSGLPKEKS